LVGMARKGVKMVGGTCVVADNMSCLHPRCISGGITVEAHAWRRGLFVGCGTPCAPA
jgi:hypothetical protein